MSFQPCIAWGSEGFVPGEDDSAQAEPRLSCHLNFFDGIAIPGHPSCRQNLDCVLIDSLLAFSVSYPTDDSRFQQGVFARRLGAIAIALFVLYTANVLARIIPVRLLLASWQLEFSASLIDAAPIALLGLILVHLAAYVDPSSPIIKERKQRISRMAMAAVLGFLLLIPLNVYAVWTGLGNLQATRSSVEVDAVRRIDKFRQIVSSATTPEDLQQRLESIGVPGLRPSDFRQPLPRLKQLLLENLDKAQGNLEAKKTGAGDVLREGLWSLIQSVLKLVVASLALALAFAAGAQGRNSDISLLESWQGGWDQRFRRGGRRRSNARVADEEYLRQLSGGDDVP